MHQGRPRCLDLCGLKLNAEVTVKYGCAPSAGGRARPTARLRGHARAMRCSDVAMVAVAARAHYLIISGAPQMLRPTAATGDRRAGFKLHPTVTRQLRNTNVHSHPGGDPGSSMCEAPLGLVSGDLSTTRRLNAASRYIHFPSQGGSCIG
jgi:hypothetical protein